MISNLQELQVYIATPPRDDFGEKKLRVIRGKILRKEEDKVSDMGELFGSL